MLKTVEAIIEGNGRLRLVEEVDLRGTRRVLVTFLDEADADQGEFCETALLSETALREDWNRPEEDEAWQPLR